MLACMPGTRRVGITAAASALQRSGLIQYGRGELTVPDLNGLKTAVCSCHAAVGKLKPNRAMESICGVRYVRWRTDEIPCIV
nr:helix-turn-helix domain-containing protein [Polaromonas sp.]